MPLNVSWKIPTILHVNHSLCPSPMVCPEFERDFLLPFIFQIFPQHTTHDFIHLAEAGENVNKACVWISRCSCLAPKSMLNHNNNSLLKASSRAKEILTLLNSCSQIATVYSRDFSLRMSVLDEEEDALDSLGDQMSRNMRDIKTNFASSKCGYTCLLSIGRGDISMTLQDWLKRGHLYSDPTLTRTVYSATTSQCSESPTTTSWLSPFSTRGSCEI